MIIDPMNIAYVQLVQCMVQELNMSEKTRESVAHDNDEPAHMLAVYQHTAALLTELLSSIGILAYDERHVCHVTLNLPVGGYVVYADKVQVL